MACLRGSVDTLPSLFILWYFNNYDEVLLHVHMGERRAEDGVVTENSENKNPLFPKISFSHLNMKLLH